MSSSKNSYNRRGNGGGHEEKNRKGKLTKKSSSFHEGVPATVPELRRPRTLPDLLRKDTWSSREGPKPQQLTKLLLNVTVLGSVGGLQVVMPPETTVAALVSCVVRQYVKEGRRPILPKVDERGFDLHYSQFCLESLDRNEKVMDLGSRNFFLCPRKLQAECAEGGLTTSSSSCNKEAENVSKESLTWLRFLAFVL